MHATPIAASARHVSQRMIAAAAGLLGLLIVYGTGLASPDAIHNATHDTRHAFALPCH